MVSYILREFDEAKHPRDDAGRFGEGSGHPVLGDFDPKKLGGLPGNSIVKEKLGGLQVSTFNEELGFTSVVTIKKDRDGVPILKLELMEVDKTGTGIGARAFGGMVDAAREAGLERIDMLAVRDDNPPPGEQPMNGFATWARFGVDGQIPEDVQRRIPKSLQKQGMIFKSPPKTVGELVATKEGMDWWRQNGDTYRGTFTLTKDGSSPHEQRLSEYLKAKGASASGGQRRSAVGRALGAYPAVILAAGPHDHGSTQLDLPRGLTRALQQKIAASDLVELEDEPHVTALYGLGPDVTVQDVRAAIADLGPVEIVLSSTASFEDQVLYVAVEETSSLLDLREALEKMPHVTKHAYVPHVTVAKVKSATAYVGDGELAGLRFTIGRVTVSSADGKKGYARLGGGTVLRDLDQPRDDAGRWTDSEGPDLAHVDPRSEQSSTDALAAIGRMGWAGMRKLGMEGKHLEHLAVQWTKDKVAAAVARLPEKMQGVVRGAWAVGKAGTKAAFASYILGQSLAERVARQRGMTDEEARKLRAAVTAVDIWSYKPVSLVLAAATGPATALAFSFVPVGSTAYLAYSAAKDPMAVLRGARDLVKGLVPKWPMRAVIGQEELVGEVADYLERHRFTDKSLALLLVALDATKDMHRALRLAREATFGEVLEFDESRHPRDERGRFAEVQAEWEASISSGERAAVESWTKGNQAEIRLAMVGDRRAPAWAKKRAKELVKALERAPAYEGTVYRGLTSLDPAKLAPFNEVGATVTMNALSSASKDVETALTFARPEKTWQGQTHATVLEIRQRSGADISKLAESSYTHQREVVLRQGTRYRVVSSEEREHSIPQFDFNRYYGDVPIADLPESVRTGDKHKVRHVVLEEV